MCLVGGVALVGGRDGLFPALVAGVGALAVSGIVVYLELRLLPRTRVGRRMYNEAASSGRAVDTGASTAVELVGKSGRALTTCAPTGMVEIEGQQYEAASLDGLLHVGDALVVAGRDTYKLLVKKAS
jgi:membrane-bound serine protease (ClpP class)